MVEREREKEREREREREMPVTSFDITLKSRVIMHMITSTARRPYASTRSILSLYMSSARVHVRPCAFCLCF